MDGMWTVEEIQTASIPSVSGLTDGEFADFLKLVNLLETKRTRNAVRRKYYEQKIPVQDLGISIPPPLTTLDVTVGWPTKAVDVLAARSVFDGFVSVDGDVDRLNVVVMDNGFLALYDQLVRDELMHSCSFVTVTKGGVGEADVLLSAYSAETASAIWDGRKKRVRCGIVVTDVESVKDGLSTIAEFVMFTDTDVIRIGKTPNGEWASSRAPQSMGRPLIEPLVYNRSVDRPFGRSRISRAVMSITDRAMRAVLRSEVSAEFYTAPQRYIMGAPDDLFSENSKWEAYIGSIFSVTVDEDMEKPTVGQFPQISMEPHLNHMRQLAAEFAGETKIPVAYLGVIHDNPASAEAMFAASEELIIEANTLNASNGESLRNIGLMAQAIIDGVPMAALTDGQKGIRAKFRSPARPSVVSSSDAMVKQVKAFPWLAETDVALEELGYTNEQIMRMRSDKKRAEAFARIEARTAANADAE